MDDTPEKKLQEFTQQSRAKPAAESGSPRALLHSVATLHYISDLPGKEGNFSMRPSWKDKTGSGLLMATLLPGAPAATITVATVNSRDMVIMQRLSPQ